MFGNIFKKKPSPEKPNEEEKPAGEQPAAPGQSPVGHKPAAVRKPAVEPEPAVETAAAPEENPSKMVPFFSWRSAVVLVLGLIVGLGLGLGYWAFSPTAVSDEEEPQQPSGGFLESLGIGPAPPTEPWRSEVRVQIVSPGSASVSMTQLASAGVYYSAKAKSLPFLQFLSTDLEANSPQYQHTIDELDAIITMEYETLTEQPTIILQVTAPTAEEALFLASRIPEVFRGFLIAEENNQQEQSRENILGAIEDVKKAIIEAEREVTSFEEQGISGIYNNPTYIALDTRVKALESELVRQANILATVSYQGNNEEVMQREYEKTQEEIKYVKTAILAAQQDANELFERKAATDITNLPSYITLTAEIAALQTQINTIMNGGIDIVTGLRTLGLAEMIANGVNTGPAYEDAVKKLNTVSEALSKDKQQLATLESQTSNEQLQISLDITIAQADIDSLNARLTALMQKLDDLSSEDVISSTQEAYDLTSTALAEARQELAALEVSLVGSNLSKELDYQIAKARVETLNNELNALNNTLSTTFVDTGGALQAIESLAVGNPSVPTIVYPPRVLARNALAIGAVLGVVVAWAVLNRRWLKKVLFPPGGNAEPG